MRKTEVQSVSARATARDIADEASEWAIRIDNGSIDPLHDLELQGWLEADPRREGALLRARAALSFMDRGRALAGVVPRPKARPFWIRRKLMLAGALLVAGLAGIAIRVPRSHHYDTGLGQIRQVPLSDGSLIEINTQSALDVALQSDLRQVTLTRGEAWFSVAHDSRRPFIVRAGDVRVRALGTAFSVRQYDSGAEILVTEGVVEVWTAGEEERRTRVAAGSKTHLARNEPPQPVRAAADIERELAWREGAIALEGETLAEAAEEFNRYNTRKLVIADPQLAGEKLVGHFRADEPMTFARAVATTLGANVVEDKDSIQLSRPAGP